MAEDRNVRLKQLQEEYENIRYSLSHDFGAPIRHVKEFTKLLIQAKDAPIEKQQAYADFVTKAVTKLQLMQQALVDFIAIENAVPNKSEISIKDLITDVLSDYEEIQDINNNIDIEETKIFVDEEHIKIIVNEIVDNALKFHSKDNSKALVILGKNKDSFYELSITDNGTGIVEGFGDRPYKLLQTLHNKPDSFQGVGAGLAIAKKYSDINNIDINITSQENTGTKVVLKIPV